MFFSKDNEHFQEAVQREFSKAVEKMAKPTRLNLQRGDKLYYKHSKDGAVLIMIYSGKR